MKAAGVVKLNSTKDTSNHYAVISLYSTQKIIPLAVSTRISAFIQASRFPSNRIPLYSCLMHVFANVLEQQHLYLVLFIMKAVFSVRYQDIRGVCPIR